MIERGSAVNQRTSAHSRCGSSVAAGKREASMVITKLKDEGRLTNASEMPQKKWTPRQVEQSVLRALAPVVEASGGSTCTFADWTLSGHGVVLRLPNSTALSLVPLTTFYLCQIDAQSFQLLQCRLGMAFPGLVIAPLCVPDLGCRLGQLLLNFLRFGDPPGSHQGRHRRVELADRQLRIFFPPIAAALAPGTGSLPPTGLDGVSAPDSGDPRIDPSRSHSCRPRSIVPRATARRPPAARSLLGFPEVRCSRRI